MIHHPRNSGNSLEEQNAGKPLLVIHDIACLSKLFGSHILGDFRNWLVLVTRNYVEAHPVRSDYVEITIQQNWTAPTLRP